MVKNFKIVIASLLFIANLANAWASPAPKVSTSIQPQSGTTNDVYRFTVSISGTDRTSPPMLSGGEDFSLRLIGPHSSVSIINGQIDARISYQYELRPKHPGNLETPQVEVEVDGNKLSAPAIKVQVEEGKGEAPGRPGDPVFLQQSINRNKVYIGEQVPLSLLLFTQYQLRNLKIDDAELDGFFSESFGDGKQTSKMINGQEYAVVEEKKALFPVKAGQITIAGQTAVADAIVPERRKQYDPYDPFGDDIFQGFFGGGKLETISLKANDLTLEVLDLPAPPSDFLIDNKLPVIVGPTSINLRYDPDTVKVGGSKTITVEVVSEGNLNQLKTLPFANSDEVRVYAEQPEQRLDTKGPKIIYHKTFRFSLVPLKKGLARVPGINIPYFDPGATSYKKATTSDIAFPVEGNPDVSDSKPNQVENRVESNSPQTTEQASPAVQPKGPIQYSEPSAFQKLSNSISLSLSLIVLLIAIIILLLAVWYIKASRKVSATPSFKDVNNISDLHKSFKDFLSKSLGLDPYSVTKDQILSKIKEKGVAQNIIFSLQSFLDELDLLHYGNPDISSDELKRLKNEAATLAKGIL